MKDSQPRRFGLIGHPLGHSLSPWIHIRIMDAAGIRGDYQLYDLGPEEFEAELPKLLPSLDGFNCTIPYKQKIIPYLREIAPSAQIYGAVNTVYQGKGYNTDGVGFASCKVPLAGKSLCLLGAGGVARVLAIEAARAGARSIVIKARNLGQAHKLAEMVCAQGFKEISVQEDECDPPCDVILNGTPLGMWPNAGALPLEDRHLCGATAVFDTIYNPTATRLVLKAKSRGVWANGGLQMLFEQALAAQKIWNPGVDFARVQADLNKIQQTLAREVLRHSPLKLVLTGFMGSGKTHIGSLLAERMQGLLPFVDLDEVIAARVQKTIPDIFAIDGEAHFRHLERECLREILSAPGSLVLATGGGAVVQAGMAELIHELGALIVYLDVPLPVALNRIGTDPSRPLLQGGTGAIETLYHSRRPIYEAAGDLIVSGENNPQWIVEEIVQAFGWID